MDLNLDLLKEICIVPGAPGFENRIRHVVTREIESLVDHHYIDNMGNVVAIKKGQESKKVMAAAHMDEISFIVKHIDENGFIRFHTLGGFDPKTLTAQKVIVHGKEDLMGVMGTKPIHVMTEEERKKLPKTTDYYIDLGLSKEEVEKVVSVGDPVTRHGEFLEMGNCVNCKSIDNRVSVFMLIETLKQLKTQTIPYDFYAVFSTQEEIGLRGVQVASHQINPDYGFGIDTTIAFDTPGAQPHEKVTELGNGVAIKVMDSATVCDPRMVAFMKSTGNKLDMDYQMEVLTGGATDTAMIQRMGENGAIAGAISIPTRNMHQVIEMAHKSDIEGSIKLLENCVNSINQHDWEYK